ncbi:MAG TPA: hemerythrin domain-containing protein [Nitrospiraceae bacterium]|nr:hemerythrin domain-containing protein [Nitrospiraceae bacterium]
MPTLVQKLTDPTVMLASDHAYVKQVMQKCLDTNSPTGRRLLVQEICDNLTIHATLEEELFYPALQRFGGQEGEEFVREALEEHQEIKRLMTDLEEEDATRPHFRTRLKTLQERVLNHAQKEEEMFPLAEQTLPIGELARQMDMRRMQLMATVLPPSGLAIMALVCIGLGALLFFTLRKPDR